MTSFSVILPLPPSLNNIYVNAPGRGRVKSAKYKAWIEEAGWLMKAEHLGRLRGRVSIWIWAPIGLRADLDNIAKPLIDLLVKMGRMDDDRNVVELHLSKTWHAPGSCHVEVRDA